MNIQSKKWVSLLSTAAMLCSCAAIAPQVLLDARKANDLSSAGAAGKLTPTEMYDAQKVLTKANKEFAANGDTATLRDLSYIALRKIQLADVKARIAMDTQQIATDQQQGVVVRDEQAAASKTALADSREQLADERNSADVTTGKLRATNLAQGKALIETTNQLADETQGRKTAESRLVGAMKDLATIAAIKEEERGLVITLSGSVLFASGQYALLDTAKTKLNQVAIALKEQNSDKKMVVEGHTDSHGSDAVNQPLSMNRAGVVRDYLIAQGVNADRITAVGMGSQRPLVENTSAENRANNRRVEIVIQPMAPVSQR